MSTTWAAYEQTESGKHLSIPVTTTKIYHTFNLNYNEGYDSDNELGPFYDAVVGEEDFDDDDDAMLVFGEHSLTVGEKAFPAADAALGNVATANDVPTTTANLTPPP